MVILGEIPIPPSLNNAYPSNRYGVRFKSLEFREWEKEFQVWALQNHKTLLAARAEFSIPRLGQTVWIQADFYFPYAKILTKDGRPKKNDTSNRLKILHDAVSSAIWLDDCYFFDGAFSKQLTTKEVGYCTVGLEWRLGSWGPPTPQTTKKNAS